MRRLFTTLLALAAVAGCLSSAAQAVDGTDQRPPIMVVTMDKTQTTRSTFVLTVFADEDTNVVVTGSLAPIVRGGERIPIAPAAVTVPAGQTLTFRTRLGAAAASALKKAKLSKTRLRFVGTDAADNPTVKSTHLVLKYKRK